MVILFYLMQIVNIYCDCDNNVLL